MKFDFERLHRGLLLRMRTDKYQEIAYATLGLRGLQAEIEFPSDWHEDKRGWVRIGFGIGSINFSFPWSKVVPDEGQCSGPTYGFHFFGDMLLIQWGKDTGRWKTDPRIAIHMPWSWRHSKHEVLTEEMAHPYVYRLHSGQLQFRTATIKGERRTWTRWWLPYKRVKNYIDVQFDGEVGERTGSWKGGCIACSYEMKLGETPINTLRRMERERSF